MLSRHSISRIVTAFATAALQVALGMTTALAQQNCEAYARSAVSQNSENIRNKCGYGGPRWHANYGLHLGWCLTQSPPIVQAESRRRQQDLGKCTGGVIGNAKQGPQKKGSGQIGRAVGPVDSFCDRYASGAVSHDKRNRANGCGFRGNNWTGNKTAHYQFCMRVGQKEARTYERGREQAIKTCLASKKVDAKCQEYADRGSAIALDILRLCASGHINSDRASFVRVCDSWPSSLRDRNIDQGIATLEEARATCPRR